MRMHGKGLLVVASLRTSRVHMSSAEKTGNLGVFADPGDNSHELQSSNMSSYFKYELLINRIPAFRHAAVWRRHFGLFTRGCVTCSATLS